MTDCLTWENYVTRSFWWPNQFENLTSAFCKCIFFSLFTQRASQSSLQLQLAPSLEHQTAAMLSILERYKWHQFSIVTSQIAGHDDFIQAVRERISDMQDTFKFTILNAVLVTKPSDLMELVSSESRVMLLYATREEAIHILTAARDLKITGENYVWVVTQSVIENLQTPNQFPVGMLGNFFCIRSISRGIAFIQSEIGNELSAPFNGRNVAQVLCMPLSIYQRMQAHGNGNCRLANIHIHKLSTHCVILFKFRGGNCVNF